MNDTLYPIRYLHDKYLFPRCSIEIPAEAGDMRPLETGQKIVVYTFHGLFSYLRVTKKVATLAEVVGKVEGKGIPMIELRGLRRAGFLAGAARRGRRPRRGAVPGLLGRAGENTQKYLTVHLPILLTGAPGAGAG